MSNAFEEEFEKRLADVKREVKNLKERLFGIISSSGEFDKIGEIQEIYAQQNRIEKEFEKRLVEVKEDICIIKSEFSRLELDLKGKTNTNSHKIESLEEKVKSFAPAIENILNLTNIERKLIRGQLEASEK